MNESKQQQLPFTAVRSALIKVEVELFCNLVVLLLHAHSDLADLGCRPVVQLAIIEDKFHILHEVANPLILLLLQLRLDCVEVHRVLHEGWVVQDLQRDVVDRVGENVRFLIFLESGKHALGSLLPLVEDWRTLRDFGHDKLTDRAHIFVVVVQLEVASNLRVLPPEVVELSVCHG
jgi:hypothetical protein